MNSAIQEEFKNHIKISQKSMENLSEDIEIAGEYHNSAGFSRK